MCTESVPIYQVLITVQSIEAIVVISMTGSGDSGGAIIIRSIVNIVMEGEYICLLAASLFMEGASANLRSSRPRNRRNRNKCSS